MIQISTKDKKLSESVRKGTIECSHKSGMMFGGIHQQLTCTISQTVPVLLRGYAFILLEYIVEIRMALKTDGMGNRKDLQVLLLQQFLCLFQTQLNDIVHKINSGFLPE